MYLRSFEDIDLGDVGLVGGKNASLGEMVRALTPLGINVPEGFCVTAEAYRDTLTAADAWAGLHNLLDDFDRRDAPAFRQRAARARQLVYGAPLADGLRQQIVDAYQAMCARHGPETTVAVRSSATAEDLPTASFAGQHETFLNVHGEEMLLDAVRRCFASAFTDRAISYRLDKGFDHFALGLSVGVQRMVRADIGASGVMFTIDTETGHPDMVLVTGAWGLGENVVQGTVDPDEFYVHKPTYREGYRAVLRRSLGAKQQKMVLTPGRTREPLRNVPTSETEQQRFCLADTDVLDLAGAAMRIETHYGDRASKPTPMDIEWARDGLDGQLYILQARPETVASQRDVGQLTSYRLTGAGTVLVTGRAVGGGIASGPVRILADPGDLSAFRDGEVLIADTTTPDWEPVMKRAAAIVTNRGGRTCHAAIVARELDVPAVVGAGDATERIDPGADITVSCAEGDTGKVYAGRVPFEKDKLDIADLPRPSTKIMMNLGNPDRAFALSRMPSDGVGLARMEFIINESIRAHPMALLHPEKVADADDRARLTELTRGYAKPADYFVERLSEGIGTVAAAFYPRPVIVRMSDFKTNEYAQLLGGRGFEPTEANPMLGFRGASRYAHPAYAEGFGLECRAARRVRVEMGLTNLKVMIPFCRRVEEGKAVLQAMADHGLAQGEDGLEVYVMAEIPNNVIQADAFAEIFDGFSIGSNDLTQLTLGVDRDSEIVAFDFDERDPGVLKFLRMAVQGARRNGRPCGICGQAPSDYPEVARFLVEEGITSLSLTPDRVLATTRAVLEIERELGATGRVGAS